MMPPEHGLRDSSRPGLVDFLPFLGRPTSRCGTHGCNTERGRCTQCTAEHSEWLADLAEDREAQANDARARAGWPQ